MSNVSPHEVLTIAANVFGVTEDDMRQQFYGGGASWPYLARCCAVLLMRRHTTATKAACARALGKRVHGALPYKLCVVADQLEAQAARYGALAELIDRCEDAIDDLHERRAA